jgi:hypothetical protein
VFIYGGGTSLRSFDPNILIDERVIVCNDAYQFGPSICEVCVFGDFKWFQLHREHIEEYAKQGGIVVTNEPKSCNAVGEPWLKKMVKQPQGLFIDALGWNCNTGAIAINLALILGAETIFLLGFDMCLGSDKKSNWHTNTLDKPKERIYDRFIGNFKVVAEKLPKVFPGRKVINVNDNTKLKCFPIVPFDDFWIERRGWEGIKFCAKGAG